MEGRAEAQALSPPLVRQPSHKVERQRLLMAVQETALRVEYPSCTCEGERLTGGLHPIDAGLLKEFWTLKEAALPSGSAVPQPGQCSILHDAYHWGPAQLHPSRLSRSVSAQEFSVNSVERCVRAGLSGKGEGRVRLGRHSAAAATVYSIGTAALAPRSSTDHVRTPTFSQQDPHPSANGHREAAPCPILTLPRTADGEAAESKQHGGRHDAMDRRVRGGRLLRSQSKDPHVVSVYSLLDVVAGPQTPRSDVSTSTTATCPTLAGELGGALGTNLGVSLGRLYSLDSNTLLQLDRALSGASELPLVTSPVSLGPATASAPAPCGLGGRIHTVRPLGAAASSLSLHSCGGSALGSSCFSRKNSTLLDLAEEQASLAAMQQGGLGAAAAAAASLSRNVDCLTLLSNGSVGGGANASRQSSAAVSLSASPNCHQPGGHVSLAVLLGAAASGRGSTGGAAAAAAGCSMPLPLHASLPADVGRSNGRSLAAPDMRFFPFSTPEDFYMAATVLLDAKLPGTLSGDSVAGRHAGCSPCE